MKAEEIGRTVEQKESPVSALAAEDAKMTRDRKARGSMTLSLVATPSVEE